MLKNAFLSSSGSKVHSTRLMPRARASSRCANLSARPMPPLRYSGSHAHHVAVQVSMSPSRLNAGKGDQNPTMRSPSNAPKHLAADFRGDHEQAGGNQFHVLEAPDLPLEPHRLMKLVNGR